MSEEIQPINPLNLDTWRKAFLKAGVSGYMILIALISTLRLSQLKESSGNLNRASDLLRIGCLLIIYLYSLGNLKNLKISTRGPRLFLSFYIIYFILSSLWSISTVETLGKGLELLGVFFITSQNIQDNYEEKKLQGLLEICLLYMSTLLHVVAIFYFLGISSENVASILSSGSSLGTFFVSPNTIGYYNVLIILISFFSLNKSKDRQRKYAYFYPIFFHFFLMLNQQGRTSIGAGVVIIILYYFRKSLLFVIPIIAFGTITYLLFENPLLNFLLRGRDISALSALSGRVGLWEFSHEIWLKNALTGVGGGAASNSFVDYIHEASSVHNGYLELIFGTGLIGAIPLLICVGRTFFILKKCAKEENDKIAKIKTIVIFYFLLISMFTSSVLSWLTPLLITFFIIISYAQIKLERKIAQT
jgi:O-antigen ligase